MDPVTDAVYGLAEVAQRARDDAAELVLIVRAVADCEPMAYCPGDEMSGDWFECGFCGVQADVTIRFAEWKPVEHREDCEWRRAVEWIEANGGTDVGS